MDVLSKQWQNLFQRSPRFKGFVSCIFLLLFSSCALFGCASSEFSRDSAGTVDKTYDQADHIARHADDNGVTESYQNSSQIVQGMMVGSAAGAVAGGVVTSGTAGILPGAGVGAIFGGIVGAMVEHASNGKDKLENRGVKVFILGDQVRIIIPSSQLFRDGTAFIYPNSYPTLDLIAKLLGRYTTMSIKVAAYSCTAPSETINIAQSKQQADSVVKYLWPRVNTRLLYGVGMGNANMVEEAGGPQNYRVEITTEKLPV